MKIIERLDTLRKLNRNPAWVNDNIFRLVCSTQLAVLAYERLKSKPGNMTAGDDGVTLDHISMDSLKKMCESIHNGSYKPSPIRRKFIPKANGKSRPLGIPSPRDKIVQEMVRLILESIYDSGESPSFSPLSHGFRANMSCHTALEEFSKWKGTTWLIEGDIKSFFDEIDHHVLVQLLRRRIKDERFINLIWNFLRVGVREEDGRLTANKLGTPQGGVISPMLANVYLHEFDMWVSDLQEELTKGIRRKPNPEWRSLIRKRDYLISKGKASKESDEVKELELRAGSMPTVVLNDPDFVRVRYVRYADDWLIGIIGSKELAQNVKDRAALFLAEKLKLTLSAEKTLITHAKTAEASFLGFKLSIGSSVKRTMVRTNGKRPSVKRVTGWLPRVEIPFEEILSKLQFSGFCHSIRGREHFPCSKGTFVMLEDHEIISRYNSIWRGIYNYYCVADTSSYLRRVMYILQYSCIMTLAHKHRRSVAKTIGKHGKYPTVTFKIADGTEKKVSFWKPTVWQQRVSASQRPLYLEILMAQSHKLVRSRLGHPCAVCNEKDGVEMHHLKALRKGGVRLTKGFNSLMSAINRKQVPLCRGCHMSVHAGRYDNLRLSDLAYIPQ